jgi:hypothetical protein
MAQFMVPIQLYTYILYLHVYSCHLVHIFKASD